MKTIILVALQEELNVKSFSDNNLIVYTGVGKVNAAIATSMAIIEHRPSKLINFGTAGGINNNLNGLVSVSKVIQRDMNAFPLAPRGVTPFDSGPYEFFSGKNGVLCGTGDSFVNSKDEWLQDNFIDIVDMELFAIAATAERFGLPWESYKYISDKADDKAEHDWKTHLRTGEQLFVSLMKDIKLI